MTLEEKIGQLVQYSAGQPTGPGTGRSDYEEMIAHEQVGSFLNVNEPQLINAYQRIAMEKTRLHIPILFGLDVIHGFKTEFPIPLGMASSWDPSIIEKASRVAAMEAAADGIRWTFSPMVDIARDARWGRMAEGAGEDPFLGSAMAAAYVRGYQGSRLDAPDSIAACAKHYVGYGAAEGRPRLQLHGNFRAHVAAVLPAAIPRSGRGRRRDVDERLQFAEWHAIVGESIYVEAGSAKRVGIPRVGRQRLEFGWRTHSARHREQMERPQHERRSLPASTWTW